MNILVQATSARGLSDGQAVPATTGSGDCARSAGRRRAAAALRGNTPLLIFIVLLVYLAIAAADFISFVTLGLVLQLSVPTVILCLGLSVVVMAGGNDAVAGGIDLSIPASAVLGAAIIAEQVANNGTPVYVALALALAAALVVGLVNATLVVLIGMTPLLATLATSLATVGFSRVVTGSRRISVNDPFIVWLRDAQLFGISVAVLIAAAAVALAYFAVHRTRWGINLQAVGGNRDAAELSGIAGGRFVAQSFVVSALVGGVAALFVVARGSGSSPGSEENLLLEMILATFLGAAFSPRRIVTLWGAVLGAVLVAALSVGFKAIGVDVFWTGCIKGALILIVVASASLSDRESS